jgi:hypothetical protein
MDEDLQKKINIEKGKNMAEEHIFKTIYKSFRIAHDRNPTENEDRLIKMIVWGYINGNKDRQDDMRRLGKLLFNLEYPKKVEEKRKENGVYNTILNRIEDIADELYDIIIDEFDKETGGNLDRKNAYSFHLKYHPYV